MAIFVLVHGAWHGGWCWKELAPRLREVGHEVHAPTLTGLGANAHHLSPAVNLDTHIQDVVGLLECEDLDEVVLVGHSYGGMVITGVAHRAPHRLRHLVYLDAYVPQDGQSMLDLVPEARWRQLERAAAAEGDGWQLAGPQPGKSWEAVVRDAYGVQDKQQVRWMVERLSPHPMGTLRQPVRCANPRAEQLPRMYIRCCQYPNDAFKQHAEEAKRPGSGWQYKELCTSHDAMITAPGELAEILLELVGRAGVVALDHVAIPCADPEAMMAFYRSLGFSVPDERLWRGAANPRLSIVCGDQKINLHAPEEWQNPGFTLRAPASRPGCGDFCFVWGGTVPALLASLSRAGATVEEGAVQRTGGRRGGTTVGASVYTRDPDGNLLEFIVYPT